MSVINQMLQDLDARRAIDERTPLPNHVRPLPASRPSVAPKAIAVIFALMFAGGMFAWYRWQLAIDASTKPSIAISTPIAPQPKAIVQASSSTQGQPSATSPAVAVASTSPTPSMPNETTTKAATASAEPSSRLDAVQRSIDYRLRVATALAPSASPPSTLTSEPIPALSAPPTTATPQAPSATGRMVASAEGAAPAPVKPTKAGSGPVVIEKQVRLATAAERAENEYRKALAELNQGRVGDAISSLRTSLKEDASHANARQTLVAVLVEQKRLDEAQALLQEGLTQNPAQPALAINLARIQVERGDIKAADDTLRRSSASAANYADYRAFHAGVLQRLGDHAAASREYQAALRLSPQSNVWWMGLGISLEAEGKTQEARTAFQRARAGGGLSAELDRFVEQKLRHLQ